MTRQQTQPPQDWEAHLASLIKKRHHLEPAVLSYHLQRALRYLPWLLQQREKRVWFAGFGLSLAPLLYASYGCSVWATEISPSAVRMLAALQTPRWTELAPQLESLRDSYSLQPPPYPPLLLYPRHENFCERAPEEDLDLVLNFRAFQCLSPSEQTQAAKIFFQSLRQGGLAIFEAHNLSPTEQEHLELSLQETGFLLPFNEAERWYKQALQELGAASFLGGFSFFGGDDGELEEEQKERLMQLRKAYLQRLKDARTLTSGAKSPERFARILYFHEV